MVIVTAGRRPDSPDTTAVRFPPQNVVGVREEIRAELLKQKPSDVVSGAACGTDLLLLDVAGELRIRRHIVLSGSREDFRKSSVADRPGGWELLYDRIIDTTVSEGGVKTMKLPPGQEGYFAANLELIKMAEALASQRGSHVLAIAIWNLESRGADDVTEHFIRSARGRRHQVIELSTLL